MSFLPHLPPPDSIIEVLWDVALIVFTIRLAYIYAGLALGLTSASIFLRSFLLNLYYNNTISFIDAPDPDPLTAPLLVFAAAAIASRLVIRRYDIPRVLVLRLAVGAGAAVVAGVGLVVACLVEWEVWGRPVMGEVLAGQALMELFWGWEGGVGILVGVALMPVAMMGWERWWEVGVGVVRGKRAVGEKGGEGGEVSFGFGEVVIVGWNGC
ncbi:hypothetical protein F5144DRAFT_54119 [Chaetomium tenue]|uniref:Uncharacterized protein n=1 Tax=Chaetomium tenue TaxID=1854479 RepID=A0ACB7PQL0_9PEZI|nr:hypothetical protein F5144DRAFT_54119 [Chaetomium globosum]